MRLYSILLLIVTAAFLATAGASSAITSKVITSDIQNDVPTKRFLRATSAVDADNDERAALSIFSKLKQVASGIKNDFKIKSMMKKKTPIDDAFVALNLDKAGKDLFKTQRLKTWNTYRQLYNKQNGQEDTAGIAQIIRKYKDDELTGMIDRALSNPSTKDIAVQFRAGQLRQWLADGKPVRDVHSMLRVRGSRHDSANRNSFKQYLGMHNEAMNNRPIKQ